MDGPGPRKDPVIATFLSFVFPGAGYLYVGNASKALLVCAIVFGLFCFAGNTTLGFLAALGAHVFFAIAAGGAAKAWNARNAGLAAPPPPPPPGAVRGKLIRPAQWSGAAQDEAPPPPPPPPVPLGPPLTPDEFLAELRAAWRARSGGTVTDAEFAEMKRSAIERVRVGDWEDGVALLEATSGLVGAGVMTPDERNRLKLKVGQS